MVKDQLRKNRDSPVMSILNDLANLALPEAYKRFSELCEDPENAQRNLLLEILAENSLCEFGVKHQFANIATFDDYKKHVPISTWSDYESAKRKNRFDFQRLANGIYLDQRNLRTPQTHSGKRQGRFSEKRNR